MFNENIKYLEKFYPEIYYNLNSTQDEELITEEVYTRDSHKNLKIKLNSTVYLHSNYCPYNQAKKWLATNECTSNLLIVVGGGYYYHIEELLNKYPEKKIIIIEPSKIIFNSALRNVDIRQFIKNNNLFFIMSMDTYNISILLAKILINKGFQNFDLLILPSYKVIFSDFYNDLCINITETLKMLRCNIATEYIHSQKWMYNHFRNVLKTNVDSVNVRNYNGVFNNIPALIVAAGPSLEKQLKLLKGNSDKFLIIAAGSAFSVLEKNGISPHFVIAVDGEEIQDNLFNSPSTLNSRATLLYSHTFRYSARNLFTGNKVWIKGNADYLVDHYENFVGINNTDEIEFGPSCANVAMTIAKYMGCRKIIFIGQDLAYTNEQLYSKGAALYKHMNHDIGDRVLVKDQYGKEVTTKTAFIVMKSFFEQYIKQNQNVEFINCTEGGLNIEGMTNTPFKSLIDSLACINFDIFTHIEDIFKKSIKNISNSDFSKRNNYYMEYVRREAQIVSNLSKQRLNRTELLYLRIKEGLIEGLIQEFEEINTLTNEIEEYDIHKGAISPIVAAYMLSIRQNSYNLMSQLCTENELLEKYGILFEGLKKQYTYYDLIVTTLLSAIKAERGD